MKKIYLFIALTFTCFSLSAQTGADAARLVQQQLDAYNKKDLEAFLKPYSDTVKIYEHPNKLTTKGIENMRPRYIKRFSGAPDLHCTLMNRMVMGNVVTDHESVIFDKNEPPHEVIAIYKIAGGKIVEVYFIRPDEL